MDRDALAIDVIAVERRALGREKVSGEKDARDNN